MFDKNEKSEARTLAQEWAHEFGHTEAFELAESEERKAVDERQATEARFWSEVQVELFRDWQRMKGDKATVDYIGTA